VHSHDCADALQRILAECHRLRVRCGGESERFDLFV
jgi:hypothetical protein